MNRREEEVEIGCLFAGECRMGATNIKGKIVVI